MTVPTSLSAALDDHGSPKPFVSGSSAGAVILTVRSHTICAEFTCPARVMSGTDCTANSCYAGRLPAFANA